VLKIAENLWAVTGDLTALRDSLTGGREGDLAPDEQCWACTPWRVTLAHCCNHSPLMPHAVVTSMIPLPFDGRSTAYQRSSRSLLFIHAALQQRKTVYRLAIVMQSSNDRSTVVMQSNGGRIVS